MNGIHDMGGMTDFGPVQIERDEPTFHAEWERRVLGMVRLTIDERYNWDEFRSAIERLAPVEYLSASYYERWLAALERYLIEKGDLGEREVLEASGGTAPRQGVSRTEVDPDTLPDAVGTEPRFRPGDRVVVRNVNPSGHTRLPRYTRGKTGEIDRFLNSFTFPDRNSLELGNVVRPVYAVRFTAQELWGKSASPLDSVTVDMWEDYIEPARSLFDLERRSSLESGSSIRD
jgi:nitrile hydratase